MDQEPNTIREELAMIDERVERLDDKDRSSTKVQLLERAVKLAERLQDDTLKLKYYKEITDAIYYSSDMELMFIYFPKMLKMLDDSPDEFGYYDKLLTIFKYKWLINQSLNYPQIPFTRVEALCDDFESRLLTINHSVRPALSMRCQLEKSRMNYERAVELNEEVERHDRGLLSDCRACEHSSHISSLFSAGRVSEGEELFEIILADGKECNSAPFTSYAQVAHHALSRGDMERALSLIHI